MCKNRNMCKTKNMCKNKNASQPGYLAKQQIVSFGIEIRA